VRRARWLAALVAVAVTAGCSSKQATTLQADEVYFAEGKKALEKKRYLEAVEKFHQLVGSYPGSPLVAEAQYLLAEAHFRNADYVNAVFEYQRLVDSYPSSEWVDEAQFQIAESYYRQRRRPELDQKETNDALVHFRLFIDDNPQSPLVEQARQRIEDCRGLLAHKLFLSGRLYQRQGHLEAAATLYQKVLQDFPDTPWYWEALAELGEVAAEKKDLLLARSRWEEVLRESRDEELKLRVQKRLDQIESGE
jgi:outer membrane protein assembly factor BamD